MLTLNVLELGKAAILYCKGRIVKSEDAYKLRNAVTAESDKRMVVLDMSEVEALEGGALGILVFLQRWTKDNGITLKLFHPSSTLSGRLQRLHSAGDFSVADDAEMLNLLTQVNATAA